MKYCSNIL